MEMRSQQQSHLLQHISHFTESFLWKLLEGRNTGGTKGQRSLFMGCDLLILLILLVVNVMSPLQEVHVLCMFDEAGSHHDGLETLTVDGPQLHRGQS